MSSDRFSNLVLQSLSEASYNRLSQEFRSHEFSLGEILFHPEQEIDRVYFPSYGTLASVIAHTAEGESVEIGIAAHDGCAGVNILLGANHAVHETLIQIAGTAVSVSAETLRREFNEDAQVRKVFLRYINSFFTFVSQTALCNRLHTMEERLARWLLTSQDCVGDELATTQEFLSRMLGSSRASVNLAAGNLQRSGVIQYNRGKVLVKDREGLESVSCECYAVARKHRFLLSEKREE